MYNNYKGYPLEIICKFDKMKEKIINHSPSLKKGRYYPTVWLYNTLSMAIWGNFIWKNDPVRYEIRLV